MKESELKEHERVALSFYRSGGDLVVFSHLNALREFGKEIAEKLEHELKPVDMSVLVNSGIDCVFSDDLKCLDTEETFSLLGKIDQESMRFLTIESYPLNYCKPRMNYWFSAENFEDVDGLTKNLEAAGFSVSKKLYGTMRDLKTQSFMIKCLKHDFCWPWEVE